MKKGNNYTGNQNEGNFLFILPSFSNLFGSKLRVNFLMLYRIPYFRIQENNIIEVKLK